jgi:hypothetical protein
MMFAFIVQRGGLPAKRFKRRRGPKTPLGAVFAHQKCRQANKYMCRQLYIQ